MKKVLLIAVMALVSFTGFAQLKIAHVNFSELVYLMPEMDVARNTMNVAQQEAAETYQTMVEEYQTKYQQYQQKASTWTAAIRESKERELQDITVRIEDFNQSIQNELAAQQQQLTAPIQQKAQETVQKIAKEGGYAFVVDAASYIYVDATQSTDLTPLARKALNIPEGRTLETLQAELEAAAAAQQQQ